MKNTLNINFDNIAIGFSVVCALHCLLLPIAVIFLPAISATFLGSEEFHKTLLYFVIPSSIIALSLGCKMHGKYNVYLYGIFGIGTLLIGSIFSISTFWALAKSKSISSDPVYEDSSTLNSRESECSIINSSLLLFSIL